MENLKVIPTTIFSKTNLTTSFMSIRLFCKTATVIALLLFSKWGLSQSLRDFDFTNYTGFAAIYKQPACTKCFTDLAAYFDGMEQEVSLDFLCVAPMNSIIRRSDRVYVCELTKSIPENIKFVVELSDIEVDGEDTLLFPHLLFFESGQVVKELKYTDMFTSTELKTSEIQEFITGLNP